MILWFRPASVFRLQVNFLNTTNNKNINQSNAIIYMGFIKLMLHILVHVLDLLQAVYNKYFSY
jgi:hypothetical protein